MESLNKLIYKFENIKKRLDGLLDACNYILENTAYVSLPKLLKKDGYEIEGDLIRKYFWSYEFEKIKYPF